MTNEPSNHIDPVLSWMEEANHHSSLNPLLPHAVQYSFGNQRFVLLDRAIEQNQRLNRVYHVRVSPSSTPHGRSASHSPQTEYTQTFPPDCRWIPPWSTSTTGRVRRGGGGQLAVARTPKNFFTCMLWPAVVTFERGAVACIGKRRGQRSLDRRAASMPAPVGGRVHSGPA
jgi:hypothetical protein